MKVTIAQLIVSEDIDTNLEKVLMTLQNASSGEWVLFPEGMISGYFPEDDNYLSQLNESDIANFILKIEESVKEKNCYCLIGSALKLENKWYNCTLFITPNGNEIYKKNNLSNLDRNHFNSGNELKTYANKDTIFGIQMCRELVFPEQWKVLKKEGAQVFFHINNSIKESDKVREHLLIARAFENQTWVCSANNAASPQTMLSMIIDPLGKVIWQSAAQKEEVHSENIDLSKDSNLYLEQERNDLVSLDIINK